MKSQLLFLVLMLLAQRGGGHTLWGDFSVDESKVEGLKPQAFSVLLYDLHGNLLGRQTVTPQGRYRFLNVPNGEYEIVVEMETQEVARFTVRLSDPFKTDVRHNLELQWSVTPGKEAPGRPAVVSPADFYKRPAANKSRFEEAQRLMGKKDSEAMKLLQEIVQLDPKDFEAWTEMGTIHFRSGRIDEAEKAYQQALREQPSYLLALMNLGKLRFEKKDYLGAIEILSRAVEKQPPSADANHLLGEAYLQTKKGSKAVVHFAEALRLDPIGKADIHLRLAALYHAAGMKDKAAAEYEQLLAKKPDSPDKKKLQDYVAAHKKP